MIQVLFLAVVLALVLLGIYRVLQRRGERARLLAQPFPEEWRRILERNVPLYSRFSAERRRHLEETVQQFLVDVPFEGCGGLTVDDEIRVTVAGQACMLLLGRNLRLFPRLRSVLVYPSAYRSSGRHLAEGGVVAEGESSRLGESWGQGYVVLAWDAVLHGASDLRDGHNVVLHEFAHQLDQEDGVSDGIPIVGHRLKYGQWARVLERDFEKLIESSHRGRAAVLDAYGATNKAEFFAVATETFFEKPKALKNGYPELYELLEEFYGLQPDAWD